MQYFRTCSPRNSPAKVYVEPMRGDAGSHEVVVGEAANSEHLGGNLRVFPKEAVLIATLHKQYCIGILGLDGHHLLFQWGVLLRASWWACSSRRA